jgi:hypothetical protein
VKPLCVYCDSDTHGGTQCPNWKPSDGYLTAFEADPVGKFAGHSASCLDQLRQVMKKVDAFGDAVKQGGIFGRERTRDELNGAITTLILSLQNASAQDVQQATMFRWLRDKAHIQDSDGGYTKTYVLPSIQKEGGTFAKHFHWTTFEAAVKAAMAK